MTKEEAIRKLTQLKNKYLDEYVDYDNTASAYDMAIEALSRPEQKIGKWKMDKEGNCCCPECGLHYDSWVRGFNYCPNCGTKMEVKNNEN